MSKEMKIIMESWRSSPVVQKVFGDKFKLDQRGPKKNIKHVCLAVVPFNFYGEDRGNTLILWSPLLIDENDVVKDFNLIGVVDVTKLSNEGQNGPCIPETYQVKYSAVDKGFQGKGYGSLIYGLVFHHTNNILKAGLTSDHEHTSSPDAKRMWDKYADTKNMEKLKTPEGNDEFDYFGDRTEDEFDDCEVGHSKRTVKSSLFGPKYREGLASHSSWVMKNNKFSGAYNKLKERHKKILANHPDEIGFTENLFKKAIDVFDVAYGD